MRENGPLLSPPGTKGGPRAVNFPGPPKNTFCPGWSHDPGQKALLFRVVPSPGTKSPLFIQKANSTRMDYLILTIAANMIIYVYI